MKNPFHDISTSTVNINNYNFSINRTLHHVFGIANFVREKVINNGENRFIKLRKDL